MLLQLTGLRECSPILRASVTANIHILFLIRYHYRANCYHLKKISGAWHIVKQRAGFEWNEIQWNGGADIFTLLHSPVAENIYRIPTAHLPHIPLWPFRFACAWHCCAEIRDNFPLTLVQLKISIRSLKTTCSTSTTTPTKPMSQFEKMANAAKTICPFKLLWALSNYYGHYQWSHEII